MANALSTDITRVPVPPAIALMHPAGRVRRASCLGPGSGETGSAAESSPPERVDLGWLMLARRDCRTRGWPEAAIDRLSARIAADGLLYVMPPPGWRRRVQRLLSDGGWQVSSPVAHVGFGGHQRGFIPLTADGLSLAIDEAGELAGKALKGMASLIRRGKAATALIEGWPQVGLAAWRPGSPGPYAWLKAAADIDDAELAVSGVQGWRGPHDSLLLRYRGTASGREGVAKISRDGQRQDAEVDALRLIAVAARSAGVRIPEVLGGMLLGPRQATLMTRIEGARAARRLRGRPHRLVRIVELTGGWLLEWNRATTREAALTAEELERWIIGPAEHLVGDLRVGVRYLEALRAACSRVIGRVVSRVSVHNDLTMHNVLVADDSIGIVDWESAQAEGLPLVDLEYMVVDAVAAADGYHDRAAAWSRCCAGRGAPALLMREWRERSIDRFRLSEDMARLCHQACWLGHARNEAARDGGSDADRPFLEIANRMAAAFLSESHG